MARLKPELIEVLRITAKKIANSKDYQWGHMGACNCGFLAQEVTRLQKNEIHTMAMQRYGDWNEQLNDYCPTSGLLMDDLISRMLEFGFDVNDLKHLEKLSDPAILSKLPVDKRYPKHNCKDDVVLYLQTWADKLENELLEQIYLPADLGTTASIL